MTQKLTKRLIDSLTCEAGNLKDIRWDSDMAGFGVRLYPSGKKSFVISYRAKGKKILYTIGQYGKVTLEQAKEIAVKRFGDVADNKDPLQLRKSSKKKHEWTVKRAADSFIEKYAKEHTRNWKETERIFNHDLIPALGKLPIDEVSKDDILKLIDAILERGSKIMANRTLAHIRKFFNWCVERNLIPYSPAYKISAPAKSITRDRVLMDVELKEIWQHSDNLEFPFKTLIKFMILTGQRRNEVATMRWTDIDRKKNTWTIPKEMNKSDREHTIPLSDFALQILNETPKLGVYVFSNTGKRPFENFSREKENIDKLIEQQRKKRKQIKMQAWRFHDIRRTIASGMAEMKIAPHVIEKLLNHTSGVISGVAAIYNRYQYMPEMKDAINLWTDHVQEILVNDKLEKSFIGRP